MSGRNIFVFFDGTKANISSNTNIARLRNLVSRSPAQFPYRPGPGASASWNMLRKLNIILGFDLDDTAKSVYRELLTWNITPFDRLFIFGYSRGAVSARILVQMITISSVRNRLFALGDLEAVLSADIHFVGLFDPVVGWPFTFKRSNRERQISRNQKVKNYVELLAIDERFLLFPSHTGMPPPELAKSRYTSKGAAMPTPELSAQGEMERKWLGQRMFVWMPGEHADVGGHDGDPVIAEHSLLTMVELMLVYSEYLNEPVYLDSERLSDHFNSIEMDTEVEIGAGSLISRTLRHFVGWRSRKPTKGDGSVLHEFAKILEGRPNVRVKYFRKTGREYRLSKHYQGIGVEAFTYYRTRQECAPLDTDNLEVSGTSVSAFKE